MGLDPNYLYDNSDVIWYGTDGYANALSALQKVTGKSETAVEMMLNGKYGAADYWTAVEALKDKGVVAARNTNGYRCFAYSSDVTMTAPSGPTSAIDSNATSTAMVKASPVYDVVVDDVPTSATYGKVLTNPVGNVLTPEHGFYGWKFFAGEAVQAIGAAGTGISLGKVLAKAVYDAQPGFLDETTLQSFNPETWNDITNGDDSFAAGLFNMVFGLDPNTGKGQAFIDENAFAYIAQYLYSKGVFATGSYEYPEHVTSGNYDWDSCLTVADMFNAYTYGYGINADAQSQISQMLANYGNYKAIQMYDGITNFIPNTGLATKATVIYAVQAPPNPIDLSSEYSGYRMYIVNQYYRGHPDLTGIYSVTSGQASTLSPYIGHTIKTDTWGSITCGGFNVTSADPVEGIGTQPGATVPDTTNWSDPANILPSLQQQYPDLWDNAVPNTIVQPDGSTKTIVYVPIAMPNANGQWDDEPTSSTTSQADPQVQPQTNPTPENNDLLKLLLQLITMPQPNPETDPQTQTQPQPNIPTPTTTGTGDTPTPVPPVGNASALWSVYHPTQAQVNAFGAWLWTDNIIQRIQQVLQNPMEGIITLHKVFGMPVDSGQGTIVVGRLDSNVPSATVTQQYITVDCGSVDCVEEFGTVFDYPPYTEISLYLPFIGIVPLNVNDIMRSQIHITYGIDVFTGACLAMVEVTRDANVVNMYQYSGIASVEYPLTGSIHTGLITGLLGAAGGIAMLATGGAATPVVGLLGAAGSAFSAGKQSQGRAGGFSGNAGAMGIKNPYLIIERPQVKTAETFPNLAGFPTNYSVKLGDCEGHVVVSHVHVEGINATQSELIEIENLLQSGVLV